MKELILFSLVVLFIACQNQPVPEAKIQSEPQAQTVISTSASEPLSCQTFAEESLDVAKELENTANPGFHYRQVAMRSEASLEGELVCVSQITNSSDENPPLEQAAPAPTEALQEPTLEAWENLTQKWEYIAEKRACIDLNAESENPACEESSFFAEDGKLFSSLSDDPIASL